MATALTAHVLPAADSDPEEPLAGSCSFAVSTDAMKSVTVVSTHVPTCALDTTTLRGLSSLQSVVL